LIELGFSKSQIRTLSEELGLPTFDKPEMACLSSRIPTGTLITIEKLKMVEQAESLVRAFGVKQLRVRHLGTVARIEVSREDLGTIEDNFDEIQRSLKKIGFEKTLVEEYTRGSLHALTP
jgi:uncharacterized protein